MSPAPILAAADGPPLILASGSATRRAMLAAVGVPLAGVHAAPVDEAAIRDRARRAGTPTDQTAQALAEAKAMAVAADHPGALVLGADQMLETEDGAWLEKPVDRAAARAQLLALAGRPHRLVSAAVLVRDGRVVGAVADAATLTVRPLSPAFLDAYLEAVGDTVTTSVGGYRIEGPGLQLFSAVTGDHFTILGLPLLPLLALLRTEGLLCA
ncbi:Maf family protein [Roseospira navarrensis]|uniref:Nucleoside triphosphate pyrophosphatase n=1 Tax=Roseospira navarrensis TaxID=140058 RepID=A0A7X1ZFF8_9PROT|nr:Maf family protein [Roseospira navarrensis]MQX37009.1 septum formation protein Maf [Roseospira navarrensis]